MSNCDLKSLRLVVPTYVPLWLLSPELCNEKPLLPLGVTKIAFFTSSTTTSELVLESYGSQLGPLSLLLSRWMAC
jgi:hypothetical protein